jgi:hypothetical protein
MVILASHGYCILDPPSWHEFPNYFDLDFTRKVLRKSDGGEPYIDLLASRVNVSKLVI